jgi:hypothetical protein
MELTRQTAARPPPTNPYATDGVCHNAELGTYNHECGKPAKWLGIYPNGRFAMGFCDACRQLGYEARTVSEWQPLPREETCSLS